MVLYSWIGAYKENFESKYKLKDQGFKFFMKKKKS